MQFQWYPGHMTKAKRQMQEDIKLIDLIIELIDARIPYSSRNPDIDELGKNKARLILMNKADLADEKTTKEWSAFFKEKGYYTASIDARNRGGMKAIQNVVLEACKEKTERDRKRGIKAGTCHGGGNPQRGKIHIYQQFLGKGMYQNREQARSNQGKTVDSPE